MYPLFLIATAEQQHAALLGKTQLPAIAARRRAWRLRLGRQLIKLGEAILAEPGGGNVSPRGIACSNRGPA